MFLCSLCGKAIKWNKRSNSIFVINKYKDDKSNSTTLSKNMFRFSEPRFLIGNIIFCCIVKLFVPQ